MDEQANRSTGPEGFGTAARMQEVAADKVNQAKDAVVGFGKQAVDTIDAKRAPAATALEETASALHEKGDEAASVAHRTADTLQATADYIRKHDLKAMTGDVESLVRRYPARALAVAAITGFVIARALRRSD